MSLYNHNSVPSTNYNLAKSEVLHHLHVMKLAIRYMGDEHIKFHDHFTDAQNRLEDVEKTYNVHELDVEVIRETALDKCFSPENLPKVMDFGRMVLEKALKEFLIFIFIFIFIFHIVRPQS